MEFSSQSQAASASQLPLAPAGCVSICKGGKNSKELITSLTRCRRCADMGFYSQELLQGEDSGTSHFAPGAAHAATAFLGNFA